MNRLEFLNGIRALLTDFSFNESISSSGCIHGQKKVPYKTIRDDKKTLINVHNTRSLFISGSMYPNTTRDFIYCTVYTLASAREYRHKKFYDEEYHKLYFSAKNYELLLKELEKAKVQILD